MDNMRAYGAAMAGGAFDPATFIKKPSVILRIISLVFSLVIWGCISGGGWFRKANGVEICLFGESGSTCSFGVAIAFFSIVACVIFLIADAMFERISSVQQRKQVVLGDLGSACFFAFFFFIVFITLWSKYGGLELEEVYDGGPPKWAIFFSFVSTITWGGVAFFAWRRYQEGAATAFAPSYEQDFGVGGGGITGAPDYGYAGGPAVGGTESYQEPPFTATNQAAGGLQYKQPAY